MYTLNNPFFDYEATSIDELIGAVLETGADPNYEVMYNGNPTGEELWELMEDQV